jgi:phosphopantetheinyl transferase (holo-ACP synthase)
VAHDGRFVVAAASGHSIGIDVEPLNSRALRSAGIYMAESEIELLTQSAPHPPEAGNPEPLDKAAKALRVWSVKEAVAKALNIPLAEAWQRVAVTRIKAGQSRFRMDSNRSGIARHQTLAGHLFTLVGLK